MTAFYSEHDPYAAQWLRNLIAAGHIAPGIVDERDIREIRPEELVRFTQCHFFAGIGVWSYALRRAGWPDDRPIWTGSCPCQPFSDAGRSGGEADERHLWPHWHFLIDQCRPPVFIGEQVASEDGLHWLDLVLSDAEASNYAAGATDICAAGFGGAHIRQRLYLVGLDNRIGPGLEGFPRYGGSGGGRSGAAESVAAAGASGGVADTPDPDGGSGERGAETGTRPDGERGRGSPSGSAVCGVANADGGKCGRVADGEGCQFDRPEAGRQQGDSQPAAGGELYGLADAERDEQRQGRGPGGEGASGYEPGAEPGGRGDVGGVADARCVGVRSGQPGGVERAPGEDEGETGERERLWPDPEHGGSRGPAHAPMLGRNPADWLFCRDGRWRPVEPGTFPLVDATPARVGRLRAYGNALDAETAQGFVEVVMEILEEGVAA